LVFEDDTSKSTYGNIISGTSVTPYTFSSLLNGETIVDETPKYKTFGNCSHTRAALDLSRLAKDEHFVITGVGKRRHTRSEYFLASQFHTQIETAPTIIFQADDWNGWSHEALESCLPTFTLGGESLVNAVLELKKAKDLIKPWLRWLPALRSFVRTGKGLAATPKRKGLFSPKAVADYHLNISFGWGPFLADVQRARQSLETFQRRLRELQKHAGEPQKRHYKRYVDLGVLPPSQVLYTDSVSSVRRETTWLQKPLYCATVEFLYTMPDMSLMSNKVKGYLDHLGFQLNPRILWDDIPYSFVIDWFFDVGGWLGSLRADNLKIPATVTGFCHSIKWEWRSQYFYNYAGSATKSPDLDVVLANSYRLRYERRRDIPSWGLFSTTATIPDWKKVALGTSLLVSRSRG